MPRTTAAIATVAVLALGVAGCGSSKPLTAAQFTTQANAICKSYATKTAALNPGSGATRAQVDTAVGKVAVLIAKEVLDLRALKPPANLAKDVTAMLASAASGAETLRAQGVNALSMPNPFADADAKANALGLTSCAH